MIKNLPINFSINQLLIYIYGYLAINLLIYLFNYISVNHQPILLDSLDSSVDRTSQKGQKSKVTESALDPLLRQPSAVADSINNPSNIDIINGIKLEKNSP